MAQVYDSQMGGYVETSKVMYTPINEDKYHVIYIRDKITTYGLNLGVNNG